MTDEVFNKFLDIMLEAERESYKNDLEPFEVYAQKKKNQLIAANDEYVKHLMNGYQIIIERLSSKENENKIDPSNMMEPGKFA